MKVNMLKSLILVIMSSFVGIMANPELLTASDSVAVIGLDEASIVETVEAMETESMETEAIVEAAEVVVATPTAPVAGVGAVKPATVVRETAVRTAANKPAQTTLANNVKFSFGTQNLVVSSTTATDAGNGAVRVGKLIYGHNYTVFGNITELTVGSTFTVVENGVTTVYRVVANPINNKAGVVLDKKSDAVLSYSGDQRYSTIDVNALVKYGMGHSLVLMTCYGSNSRYVVVADVI